MEHIFIAGQNREKVFVLFHGTGGDEQSLVPIAQQLDDTYSVLSIRGDVSENGQNRYFKRKAEGVYDIEDLLLRAQELIAFLDEASWNYQFELKNCTFIGFSNGANIIIEMILNHHLAVKQAVLLAPMFPVPVSHMEVDNDLKVFISTGKHDPIVPIFESEAVIALFKQKGATITHEWVHSHEVTYPLLEKVKQWLHN